METENRQFLGVWIPKEIWLNKDLTLLEKCLLTEIESLEDEEKGCYATNKYFAEFLNTTETTISTSIRHLKELELVEQVSFNGRTRLLKIKRQTLKNLKADFKKFNTININNINNISKETLLEKKYSKKNELFASPKIPKKLIKLKELKELVKTYTLDDDILEKLYLWLDILAEKNKLPINKQIPFILGEISNYRKDEILIAIENSIRSGYTSIYFKHIDDISKDGINRRVSLSVDEEEKQRLKRNAILEKFKE